MSSFCGSHDLFFAAMIDSPPSNFSLKFWLSCMILVCCVWDLLERDFLEGFMAAIWVNTSEEKSLKNSSLKHHNHDLGKTPSSYRFWWNSWSISWSFHGVLLVLPLGCLGTPLIKSSSLLEKVCSVSLSNITFAIDSVCFCDHRIILCSAIQHHRIFLWFSSEHRIFLWFSSEHRIILWVFSGEHRIILWVFSSEHRIILWVFFSEHRIILCTEISGNHLAVLLSLDRIIRWCFLKWPSDHPVHVPQDSHKTQAPD